MISAKKNLEALQEWALDEVKNLGQRNFELAKFFFGISAGSFAIIPFFDLTISLNNRTQLAAIALLAFSIVSAVLMASPAKFVVNEQIDLPRVHRQQAKKLEILKYSWMVSWMLGVLLIFIAASSESGKNEVLIDDNPSSEVSHIGNG